MTARHCDLHVVRDSFVHLVFILDFNELPLIL